MKGQVGGGEGDGRAALGLAGTGMVLAGAGLEKVLYHNVRN